MKNKKIIITAALAYANGPIHIGHLAGVYIPADIYSRFQKRNGKEVIFISGSDEFGIPVTIRAKKEAKKPQEIVNFYHEHIKSTLYKIGISFDHYSRTSTRIHKETSQNFFLNLFKKNAFLEIESNHFYDNQEKEFLADRYIVGICPNCYNQDAYGDQCEKCGIILSPTELLNPKSILSGNKPILKSTKHWYLLLNKYQDFITNWINKKYQYNWKYNVCGQVKSWINKGLQPRSMTRDLDWGIPVPLKNAEGKVLYVWFDAPIGYISATKEWSANNGKNWKDFWQNHNTKLIHFIGKDNIIFHCIIFPIMLHIHGDYILPDNVPANEFLNLENKKISTSKNWAVWIHEYLKEFPGKEDTLRYVLIANCPENKDNNFTWKDFQIRNNSELVGILGNFINRVLSLTNKYYGGQVPNSILNEKEIQEINNFIKKISDFIEKYQFRNALIEFMNLARFGNQYLQIHEPWKKSDQKEIAQIIFVSVQIVGFLAQIMELFMPFTSKKLLKILNCKLKQWNELNFSIVIPAYHKFNQTEFLFEKIENESIQKQIDKLNQLK